MWLAQKLRRQYQVIENACVCVFVIPVCGVRWCASACRYCQPGELPSCGLDVPYVNQRAAVYQLHQRCAKHAMYAKCYVWGFGGLAKLAGHPGVHVPVGSSRQDSKKELQELEGLMSRLGLCLCGSGAVLPKCNIVRRGSRRNPAVRKHDLCIGQHILCKERFVSGVLFGTVSAMLLQWPGAIIWFSVTALP